MRNAEIAQILREIAGYYEMKNEPFKPRAYEKAADALQSFDEQAADIYKTGGVKALLKIPGVGPGIADHIQELVKTGHLKKYEQMKKKMPVNLTELTSIEGVGAKTAQVLFAAHGVEIIFLDKRVDFKMPNKGWGGSAAQFPVAWYTHGLDIGHPMTFATLHKPNAQRRAELAAGVAQLTMPFEVAP